jgi:hypothetical protein
VHKRTHRALVISNAVMMFAGYLALVTTETYTAQTLLIPIVLFVMAPAFVWLDARTTAYRIATSFVSMCISFFLFALWLRGLGELIHIITWLVIYIQFYLMCHRKTVAYYYYLFLMSFFLLIAACAQEPEATFALGLGLFILSAVWALFTLHVHAETIKNKDRTTPDIVDTGARGTIVPQQGQVVFDRNLYASIAVLSFSCLLLTILMFVTTPRMEAGIFGASSRVEATTGVTSRVDLNARGRITPDTAPVMRVQFPDEPSGAYDGELYWRSTSLEQYRNSRWERSSFPDNRFDDRTPFHGFTEGDGYKSVRRNEAGGAKLVRQEIYLDDVSNNEGLPALSFVQAMNTSAGELRWDSRHDTTIYITNHKHSSLNYEAWSDVRGLDADTLREASDNYSEVIGDWFMLLTDHDLDPMTVELARTISEDADNTYDKVMAIQNHFLAEDYLYSLDAQPIGAVNPIDNFVLNVKMGHCELYSSALALMVRSLGIPARVVAGYHGGEFNNTDQAYVVRKSMAHLWVEVYFIDYGWVTFDPSPLASDTSYDAWEQITRTAGRFGLTAKMLWYRDIVGFSGGIQWDRLREALRDTAKLDFSFLNRETDNKLSVSGFVIPLAIVWLAATGILGWILFSLVAYLRRRAARRRAGPMTVDQIRAQRVYVRLKKRLGRLGTDCEGMTSRELLDHISTTAAIDIGLVHNVIDTYNRVRFGGYTMTRNEYQRLTSVVRRIRRAQT